MAPFNAPAMLPMVNPVPGRCHSRQYFNRHTYTNPCSSRQNFRVNFSPTYADDCLHGSHTPQRVRNDFTPYLCADQDQASHAHRLTPNITNHPICRYCIAGTEAAQWFKLAQRYFVAAQPHDSHSNVSRHFLTRLCRVCEEREMRLLNQREGNGNAIRPPNPTVAAQAAMVDWPKNTCTCKKAALDPGIRCRPHRHAHFYSTIPRLNAQRVANREWLRKVELDYNGPTPIAVLRTDPNEIRRLDIRREGFRRPGRPQIPQTMRACRCGADPVDDVRRAQVLLCMSCEGIVHVHEPELPPLPLDPTTPRHLLLMNSQTNPGMFMLQRRL
jgi:hypothetical protein